MKNLAISVPTEVLSKKCSVLSNYAQNYMKSQMKSVEYVFDKIYCELNPELMAQNKVKLTKSGIKEIGITKNEGIIFAGENFDYHVSSPRVGFLQFDTLNKEDGSLYQKFTLNNQNDEYLHTGSLSGSNLEDFMSEVLDYVDSKLIAAKREFTYDVPKPFIPKETTSQKIAELNRTLRVVPRKAGIKDLGYIDEEDEKIIQSIVEKFKHIKKLFRIVPNDASRFNVRSYYKNYITQPGMNKIAFKDIGPMGEPISFAYITHKNRPYVSLSVTSISGEELNFVISEEEGSVQRNLPFRKAVYENCIKRKNSIPDYYTQAEIDNSDLYSYLSCLNRELKLFIDHTENWLRTQEENKRIYSNNDVASLESKREILGEISENFTKYKTNVMKYIRKFDKRRQFKEENGISTQLATTAVRFEEITPEGYDLRLSYPVIPNNVATQILVMKGDNIKKSFYILNEKLLRFNIRKLTDKFEHYDRNLYYYDNEHLQNSNLETYLVLLRDKLFDLNEKLDAIRAKQRKPRASLQKKTN